jgi:hypothetical protein
VHVIVGVVVLAFLLFGCFCLSAVPTAVAVYMIVVVTAALLLYSLNSSSTVAVLVSVIAVSAFLIAVIVAVVVTEALLLCSLVSSSVAMLVTVSVVAVPALLVAVIVTVVVTAAPLLCPLSSSTLAVLVTVSVLVTVIVLVSVFVCVVVGPLCGDDVFQRIGIRNSRDTIIAPLEKLLESLSKVEMYETSVKALCGASSNYPSFLPRRLRVPGGLFHTPALPLRSFQGTATRGPRGSAPS